MKTPARLLQLLLVLLVASFSLVVAPPAEAGECDRGDERRRGCDNGDRGEDDSDRDGRDEDDSDRDSRDEDDGDEDGDEDGHGGEGDEHDEPTTTTTAPETTTTTAASSGDADDCTTGNGCREGDGGGCFPERSDGGDGCNGDGGHRRPRPSVAPAPAPGPAPAGAASGAPTRAEVRRVTATTAEERMTRAPATTTSLQPLRWDSSTSTHPEQAELDRDDEDDLDPTLTASDRPSGGDRIPSGMTAAVLVLTTIGVLVLGTSLFRRWMTRA